METTLPQMDIFLEKMSFPRKGIFFGKLTNVTLV